MTETSHFKMLHSADWHVCNEFIDDARRCLDFLVKYVDSHEVPFDLIVIPGDIYNHRQIQQETEAARLAYDTVRKLAQYAPIVILTGTPSHDGKAPLMLEFIGEGYPVLVADQPSQWVLCAGGEKDYRFEIINSPLANVVPGAVISCTPAFTKQYFESGASIDTSDQQIAQEMGAIFAQFGVQYKNFVKEGYAVPHILLGHYSIGGAFIHPSQPMIGKEIEVSPQHIEMAQASIVCMGHIHQAQKIGPNIFYSGSLFANNFGEVEAKGFYVHDLRLEFGPEWHRHDSQFIDTPSPKLVKFEIDLVSEEFEEGIVLQKILYPAHVLDDEVSDENPVPDTENTIVRMEIKVFQDQDGLIDQDAIKEYFDGIGVREFRLDITRIPRANVRSKAILDADRLSEKLKLRAEIINDDVPEKVLRRADMLQDTEPDTLMEVVTKAITERRISEDETTQN